MWFSQRNGYSEFRKTIQRKSMDDALRTKLWNLLIPHFWPALRRGFDGIQPDFRTSTLPPADYELLQILWIYYFERPINEFPLYGSELQNKLEEHLLASNGNWYTSYDFIEAVLKYSTSPEEGEEDYSVPTTEAEESYLALLAETEGSYFTLLAGRVQRFIKACNIELERHMSAYRIIGNRVVECTNKEQIAAVERALTEEEPVRAHFLKAIKLLSDRKNPDYRNSVKESFDALETKIKLVLKVPKIELADGLSEIAKTYKLHPALKKSFEALYGYASQVARHGFVDPEMINQEGVKPANRREMKPVNQEEATFLLIICSAFVSYLSFKTAHGSDHSDT